MSRRTRWALYAASAVLVVFAILRYSRPHDSSTDFLQLVNYVAEHGETGTIPREGLQSFGLPDGGLADIPFRAITNQIDYIGHAKTINVRRREGATDVFLTDVFPDRGRYFRCSEDGVLIRAIGLGPSAPPMSDSPDRFEIERAYWLKWWKAKQ